MLLCFSRGSSRKQDSFWSNVVCLCATLSQVLVMGIGQGFGIFLPVIMDEFNTSREYTAWIGSIAIAMTFCLSPVTGRLCDRFGSRPVAIVGAMFCSLGLILTSLVRRVELFYLTYSVLFGFGTCCCRTANFLITAKYFVKRRSFATGLVTAGAGLGIFALAPINQALIDAYGLGIAYRVLGFVILTNCCFALCYDPNIDEEHHNSQETLENPEEGSTQQDPQGCQKLIDFSVWKVPAFAVVAVCCAGVSIVIFTPQFHLVRHCEDLGIPADKSSKLLMIYGLSSCAFRIAVGRLCDMKRVNPIYVFQFGMFASSVAVILFGVPKSYVSLAVISALFGMGDGTSLTAGNLLLLTTVEPRKRASAFGLANMLISVSIATGAPLSGFIADQAGSYVLAFYVAGSMGVAFTCLPFLLLCLKRETHLEEVKPITENDEDVTA